MSVQTTYSNTRAIGIEGQLADGGPAPTTLSMINQETLVDASDEMAFGHGIKFEGSTEDQGALNPTAETDVIVGLIIHSHSYDVDDDLGTIGVKPGKMIDVLIKGRMLVKVEDGCAPGDRLWIRAVGATAPEAIGQCNNADDGTDMIDCTNQGRFLTTAAAGGLAWIDVDFTNFPTVT